jgi:hypothetical protein
LRLEEELDGRLADDRLELEGRETDEREEPDEREELERPADPLERPMELPPRDPPEDADLPPPPELRPRCPNASGPKASIPARRVTIKRIALVGCMRWLRISPMMTRFNSK